MEYRDPGQEYSVLPENRSDANEFSLPPAGESPDEDAKKEFEYESAPEEPKHRRFSKKKRALLIQAAGIITGAVLVMNSFGLDFLGSDGFFAGSGSKTTPLSPADYDIDPMPVKDSKWPTKTHIVYHLTYMVSGETFDSVSTDEEGEAEAKAWCKSVGGDFDTKILVKAKNTANGLQKSDDAIIVGDGDNPEAIFGGITREMSIMRSTPPAVRPAKWRTTRSRC